MKPYLALARVSNLPTVWTNVLAGIVLAIRAFDPRAFWFGIAGISGIYCAGMVFNDVMDVEEDRVERPGRPIPSGAVTRRAAALFGGVLFLLGLGALLAASGLATRTALWSLLLIATVLHYDYWHRRDPLGPFVMGACRGLVYIVAASLVGGALSVPVLAGAAVIAGYVSLLTLVAKYGGRHYGWSIKWLIAGICLVDALVIAGTGRWDLALLASAGFPLTLAGQRAVSGT